MRAGIYRSKAQSSLRNRNNAGIKGATTTDQARDEDQQAVSRDILDHALLTAAARQTEAGQRPHPQPLQLALGTRASVAHTQL